MPSKTIVCIMPEFTLAQPTHLSCTVTVMTEVAESEKISRIGRIAVYSVRDKLCYDLPPIPGHYRGVPQSCGCVAIEGRIYVLGGALEVVKVDAGPNRKRKEISSQSSNKVYVLDLAGASLWKECANMERGRRDLGFAVFNEKVYVFGGLNDMRPVPGAEVYDPKLNTWSPIAPMASLRFGHRSSTLPQGILAYGGRYFRPCYLTWKANGGWDRGWDRGWRLWWSSFELDPAPFCRRATSLEFYNPGKDEWIISNLVGELAVEAGEIAVELSEWAVESDESDDELGESDSQGSLFMAQRKLHVMRKDGIYVHDDDGSWTNLKHHQFRYKRMTIAGIYALVHNDELLAGVEWFDVNAGVLPKIHVGIFQSEGFSTKNNTILWNALSKCPVDFEFMYCIQL